MAKIVLIFFRRSMSTTTQLPPEDPEEVEDAEDYEHLENEIINYWSYCRQRYRIESFRRLFKYTFRFHHWQDDTAEEMKRLTQLAFNHCDKPFKAQLSFCIMLLQRVTGERKIFYAAMSNFGLFPRMQIIYNRESENNFLMTLNETSLELILSQHNRESSVWVLERVIGFTLFAVRIFK